MNLAKFDNFYKTSVKTQKQLTEAIAVVEMHMEEIALRREVEANLRLQLTRAQDRNIALQKDVNLLQSLSGKAKTQENLINTQDCAIKELAKIVNEYQAEVKNRISVASLEEVLSKKVKELVQQLQDQDSKFYLLRMEEQVVLKEKDSIIKQLEEANNNLSNEMEKIKLEYNMMKNDVDRVHLSYSKQIMDYEQTIRQYEKDRRRVSGDQRSSILKKVETVSNPSGKKINITWADSARKAAAANKMLQDCQVSSQDMRGEADEWMSDAYDGDCQREALEEAPNPAPRASEEKRTKFRPKTKVSRPSASSKSSAANAGPTAAPLDVFSVRDDPNQPKKKRLYSSNSNHFIF